VLLGWAGFGLILLAIFIACLAIFAKEQVGGMVGSFFLPSIVGLMIAGSIALLVALWMLPNRMSGRSIGVAVWALIALTSPLFGMMFLFPWGVLLLTAPLVFAALWSWQRSAAAVPAG
jgi:hypothetical protein